MVITYSFKISFGFSTILDFDSIIPTILDGVLFSDYLHRMVGSPEEEHRERKRREVSEWLNKAEDPGPSTARKSISAINVPSREGEKPKNQQTNETAAASNKAPVMGSRSLNAIRVCTR